MAPPRRRHLPKPTRKQRNAQWHRDGLDLDQRAHRFRQPPTAGGISAGGLESYRLAADLSQTDVAVEYTDRYGGSITGQIVSKWEAWPHGHKPIQPGLLVLQRLAAIYHTTPANLVATIDGEDLRHTPSIPAPSALAGPPRVESAEPTRSSAGVASRGLIANPHLDELAPGQLLELLTHLREQWHLQVKTDNLLGAQYALITVHGHPPIIDAILDVARDDRLMVSWVLFRRGEQARADRRAAQVIGFAQAARGPTELLPAPMRAAIPQQAAPGADIERLVTMAAEDSARFGQRAEGTNVGTTTLEQLHADVGRIALDYLTKPLYPLFLELLDLRDRVFALLDGRQQPRQTMELYLLTGQICGLLANASKDFGCFGPAHTQARTAWLSAELAGHDGLRAWVRGTQSLIAYWEGRYQDAVDLAAGGMPYATKGSAAVRLATLQARASARYGDKQQALTALALAADAQEHQTGADEVSGVFAFPEAKHACNRGTTYLLLGDPALLPDAETECARAIDLYQTMPAAARSIGDILASELDLVSVYLERRDLDGAASRLRPLLHTPVEHRIDSIVQRAGTLEGILERPEWGPAPLARELREQIRLFCPYSAAGAFPSGMPPL